MQLATMSRVTDYSAASTNSSLMESEVAEVEMLLEVRLGYNGDADVVSSNST